MNGPETKLIDLNAVIWVTKRMLNLMRSGAWFFEHGLVTTFFPLLLPTGNQFPPIAAQDLPFVLKAGYLEKRRKGKTKILMKNLKIALSLHKTCLQYTCGANILFR